MPLSIRPGGEFRPIRLPGRLIRLRSTGGGQGAGARLRQKQNRMGYLNGRHIGWCHDHPKAQPGRVEQACCEVEGHPNAAMGRRIPRQQDAVERDARPGDALHVGHVGIVINVRVVLRFLLDDAKDPGGRFASLLTARHRRPKDPAVGVIDGDPLVVERDDRHDRLAGRARLDGLARAFAPTVCGSRMISSRDQRGQTRSGKIRGPQPCLLALRIHKTRPHARPICSGLFRLETQEIHKPIRSNPPRGRRRRMLLDRSGSFRT